MCYFFSKKLETVVCTWEIIVQVTLQFLRTCKSTYCYIDIYVNLTSATVLCAIILFVGKGGGGGDVIFIDRRWKYSVFVRRTTVDHQNIEVY